MRLIIDIDDETYKNVQYYGIYLSPRDRYNLEKALKNAMVFEGLPEEKWIPCSERLPDKDGRYLVTNSDWGSYEVSWNVWLTNSGQWLYNGNPIAWMEFPEAYRGDNK